jgi:hypothetical protein
MKLEKKSVFVDHLFYGEKLDAILSDKLHVVRVLHSM